MNRFELKDALDCRGVKPRDYHIVGVSEGGLTGRGELVLDRADSGWVVYATERGTDFNHEYFDSEDEAARYLFDKATSTAPVGPPPTPEENERAARLGGDFEADYREWLRGQGRDPKTGLPVDDE